MSILVFLLHFFYIVAFFGAGIAVGYFFHEKIQNKVTALLKKFRK